MSLPGDGFYDSANMWTEDEIAFSANVTFQQFSGRHIGKFYEQFMKVLVKNETTESQFFRENVWMNEKQFIWAYNMVNTRTFMLTHKHYNSLTRRTHLSPINKKYFKESTIVLLPVADFANHLFPTKTDLSDKISFLLL